MKLNYFILDVFTRQPLAGNPLAVVLKADGISQTRMQAIAAEFGLSETVFVRSPPDGRHTAQLRIFTPLVELPFAGHPTVGAAVLLGLQQHLTSVRLDLHVGTVTAILEQENRRSGSAKFALPRLPERLPWEADPDSIATALGIKPDDLGCKNLQPALYSAGVPFHLVPVRNSGVLQALNIERRGWNAVFPEGRNSVYVFTETQEDQSNRFGARMFSPGMGINEDPATGSAAAALIGLLADNAGPDTSLETTLRQGVEMGRPSIIRMQYRKQGEQLIHASIGGHAVVIAEGVLDLTD